MRNRKSHSTQQTDGGNGIPVDPTATSACGVTPLPALGELHLVAPRRTIKAMYFSLHAVFCVILLLKFVSAYQHRPSIISAALVLSGALSVVSTAALLVLVLVQPLSYRRHWVLFEAVFHVIASQLTHVVRSLVDPVVADVFSSMTLPVFFQVFLGHSLAETALVSGLLLPIWLTTDMYVVKHTTQLAASGACHDVNSILARGEDADGVCMNLSLREGSSILPALLRMLQLLMWQACAVLVAHVGLTTRAPPPEEENMSTGRLSVAGAGDGGRHVSGGGNGMPTAPGQLSAAQQHGALYPPPDSIEAAAVAATLAGCDGSSLASRLASFMAPVGRLERWLLSRSGHAASNAFVTLLCGYQCIGSLFQAWLAMYAHGPYSKERGAAFAPVTIAYIIVATWLLARTDLKTDWGQLAYVMMERLHDQRRKHQHLLVLSAVQKHRAEEAAQLLQHEKAQLCNLQTEHQRLLLQQQVLQAELQVALNNYVPSTIIDAGTPADRMLGMIADMLDGGMPSMESMLFVQSALLSARDVYQPVDLGKQMQASHLDDDISKMLMQQLGKGSSTSNFVDGPEGEAHAVGNELDGAGSSCDGGSTSSSDTLSSANEPSTIGLNHRGTVNNTGGRKNMVLQRQQRHKHHNYSGVDGTAAVAPLHPAGSSAELFSVDADFNYGPEGLASALRAICEAGAVSVEQGEGCGGARSGSPVGYLRATNSTPRQSPHDTAGGVLDSLSAVVASEASPFPSPALVELATLGSTAETDGRGLAVSSTSSTTTAALSGTAVSGQLLSPCGSGAVPTTTSGSPRGLSAGMLLHRAAVRRGSMYAAGYLGSSNSLAAANGVSCSSRASASGFEGAELQSRVPPPIYEEVDKLLASADEWQFDAFALCSATHGHPLSALGYFVLHSSGVMARYKLSGVKVARFMRRIEAGYRDNPYHSRTHAANVLQVMHVLMQHGGLVPQYCDPLTTLACYLAAVRKLTASWIVHDFEHAGVTNDFLVASTDPLALRYNDRSPQENHHLAATFLVLRQSEHDFMSHFPKSDFDKLRKTMIELVLATDMKQHFAITSQFSTVHRLGVSAGSASKRRVSIGGDSGSPSGTGSVRQSLGGDISLGGNVLPGNGPSVMEQLRSEHLRLVGSAPNSGGSSFVAAESAGGSGAGLLPRLAVATRPDVRLGNEACSPLAPLRTNSARALMRDLREPLLVENSVSIDSPAGTTAAGSSRISRDPLQLQHLLESTASALSASRLSREALGTTMLPVQPLDESERILSLQMALKCADLGHMAADLPVHIRWVYALEEEMFGQGDQEKARGLPVSPLFDRDKPGVTKSQIGFYEIVVIPLFKSYSRVFTQAKPLLAYAMRDYQHWVTLQAASPAPAAQ